MPLSLRAPGSFLTTRWSSLQWLIAHERHHLHRHLGVLSNVVVGSASATVHSSEVSMKKRLEHGATQVPLTPEVTQFMIRLGTLNSRLTFDCQASKYLATF